MPMLWFSLLSLLLQAVQGRPWLNNIKPPAVRGTSPKWLNLFKGTHSSKFGDKQLVVITGTSSGLGKKTAKALLRTKKYHVVGAVRDLAKMNVVAEAEGFDMNDFTPMYLDLASFDSVDKFAQELDSFRGDHPIDRLACNAAVYQPTLPYPKWTVDGHEQQLQINYLSHFLLTSKVMPMMADSDDPRICMIGSVTGNDNTVGGGGVYPIADLKELEGLELGCKNPIAMMDGYNFNGAKAYKDTKLALMMTSNMLHERFHRSTGIAFSSIYPGCIAESPLFREKRPWFRKYFPIFMKYITGGFVGEEEAGQRLFQVLHDPRCRKSGIYWGWNGGAREGRGAEALEKGGQIIGSGGAGGGWESVFENDQSDKVLNKETMLNLWRHSTDITGASWPAAYQPKSPCPTLKVVGAATSVLGVMEEAARMRASREGAGAHMISNHSVPKEQRRKIMEEMLLKLDNTPSDPTELKKDYLRTSGMSPATIAAEMAKLEGIEVAEAGTVKAPKEVTEEELKAAFANENLKLAEQHAAATLEKAGEGIKAVDANVPEIDDPADEAEEEKGPPKMIPGHEDLGDTPVVFQPANVMTMARVGQPLSDVAAQADVFIRYKCRKGECKTCVVNIDGRWVSACQTKIPPVAKGENFGVRVRKVSEAHKYKQTATFFSPRSIIDGAWNNALGMVGFARDAFGADPDFEVRMERERMIQEIAEKKKKEAQEKEKSSLRGSTATAVRDA
eukprot:gnl/TRDRNA2_/TRDRNA2_174142_c1_seq1.p1 gnl/TRDRNA2_/TRDRNA2_174142_c1~~gnl/TRDRNA2_/TRDRNA2_174142_c1_seq1.p1  ORF type:complete len:731 (+),score=146.84 gnl/TRDRNA2_/TRDRNA2_174142_c1_seq1:31-2223(+)